MARAGLVAIDSDQKWIGGRYYLQHLVRCCAAHPGTEAVELRQICWHHAPADDSFAEVRDLLGPPRVVALPSSPLGRLRRKLGSPFRRRTDAADLFAAAGVEALFPITPCERPGIPLVFWLPDFQYLRRPDLLTSELRDAFEEHFRINVARATRVVLSSEDALGDFERVFPERRRDARVVRFVSVPSDDWWREDPARVADRYGLPERFFISCNQFTRHKNHGVLLRALGALRGRGRPLPTIVFTGSTFDHRGEGWADQMAELAHRLDVGAAIRVLGLVPRADQIALLRRSVAVLQPSSFEGWSTVVEDAKSLGKPTLVSSLPVHREQLGSEAFAYLPESDAEAWAAALLDADEQGGPGPDANAESAARARLDARARACAGAFSQAIRESLLDGPRRE